MSQLSLKFKREQSSTPLNMKVFHHINLSPRRAPSIGVPTSDPNAANANARPIRNLVKTFRGSKYEL